MEWQSKDTPAQFLDLYEIREDGTLWHEEYDERFEETPEAPLGFYIHRENKRWISVPITGEIEIHTIQRSIQFWFRNGRVKDVVFYQNDKEVVCEPTEQQIKAYLGRQKRRTLPI